MLRRVLHSMICVSAALMISVAIGCSSDAGGVTDMFHPTDGEVVINGHPFLTLSQGALVSCDSANKPKYWQIELWDLYGDGCPSGQPPDTAVELRFQIGIDDLLGTHSVSRCNPDFTVGKTQCSADVRSGNFTILKQTAQRIAGTYDVVFVGGEHLAGYIDALVCPPGC